MESVIALVVVSLAVAVTVESTPICLNTCVGVAAAPICARAYWNAGSQLTFANQCQLNYYNCRNPLNRYYTVSTFSCPSSGVVVCSSICLTSGSPILTYQFSNIFITRTFNAQCELNNFNCANPGSVFVPYPTLANPFP